MSDLKTAAQQALEALENAEDQLAKPYSTQASKAITALKAALAEPVQQGCDHCNQPLYAAVKCRVCGRVTQAEPVQDHFRDVTKMVQEPVALDWLHKWANQDDGEPETQWHEGYEAARRVVQIHLTTPPQRKPLRDEEILAAVGWERAEMYMKLVPNFPVDEAKQETLKNARAVERKVRGE